MPQTQNSPTWFTVYMYVIVPVGAIGTLIQLVTLLDTSGASDSAPILAFLSLTFSIFLFVGMQLRKPWGWYLLMLSLVLGPLSATANRASVIALKANVLAEANAAMEKMGNAPIAASTTQDYVSLMILLLIALAAWSLPNAVYFYRRRSWFGVEDVLGAATNPFATPPPPLPNPPSKSDTQPPFPTTPPILPVSMPNTQATDTRTMYAQALRECDDPILGRDDALWAMAVVQTGGNVEQTHAVYIGMRVRDLSIGRLMQDLSTASAALDPDRMESALSQLRNILPNWPSDLQHAEARTLAIRKLRHVQETVTVASQQLDADLSLDCLARLQLITPVTIVKTWESDLRALAIQVNAKMDQFGQDVPRRITRTILAECDTILERLDNQATGTYEPVVYNRFSAYIPKDSTQADIIKKRRSQILAKFKSKYSETYTANNFDEAKLYAQHWVEWCSTTASQTALQKATQCAEDISALEALSDLISNKRYDDAVRILHNAIAVIGGSQILVSSKGETTLTGMLREIEQLKHGQTRRLILLVATVIAATIAGVWSLKACIDHIAATTLSRSYHEKVLPLLMQHEWSTARAAYNALVKSSSPTRAQIARSTVHTRHLLPQAQAGIPSAQSALGWICKHGFGLGSNVTEATVWYRKAAEQGNSDAQLLLGNCYRWGDGVQQNDVEAVKWYRKAAEQGNSDAQLRLASIYASGEGILQNDTESLEWYRKAAGQGNVRAKLFLDVYYPSGRSVVEHQASAVKWYRQAADQGNADGQFFLGGCYESGSGVLPNKNEAVKWYRQAANQGHVEALKALERL